MKWWRRFVRVLLIYAVFGFLIAPWIVRGVVLWQLPKKLGRPVSLQKIKLNPFAISIAIDGFTIAEPDGAPFAGWDEVYVNFDPAGLFRRQLAFSTIAVSNAFGHVQANHDGTFNFSDILQRIPPGETNTTSQPMVVRIDRLRVTGGKVVYDDRTRATPFSTTIGPIDVTLHDFSTSPDNRNPYGFTAVTESGETFSWRGFFYLGPVRSSGEFAVEGVALKKYAPFYDDLLHLTLHDGRLNVRASYEVEMSDRLERAQVSNLTFSVRSLKIAERGATNDAVEVPSFDVTGVSADAVAQIVEIESIQIADARLNIRRHDDGTINLLTFLPAPTTNAPAASTNTAPAWTATIRAFVLTNAALDYADQSPPAALAFHHINVTVNGLSTSHSIADLRATGRLGNLGSFEATGRINPFSFDAATELQAALHQMDLVPVGPYSGKYAGYDVRRGKLNVAVHYTIHERQLTAQNSIEVDQFTFGEKVESPDAVKLPVKLAVAILKDRDGKIALDVPVEGRIDDPQFRYWGAVWHVLGNLFTKIFTAPFSMLGSMFGGGGEELGWQQFAPGSAELLPDEVGKLAVLIKAMEQRPALNIEIEGNVDRDKDREPLQRRKLQALVAARAGTTNDYVAWLRVLYAEALPEIQSKLAPPPAPPKIDSNVQKFGQRPAALPPRAQRAAAELTLEEMERGYFTILDLTADDYRPLAEERARRVREYLLETGHVDAERVFLADLSRRALPAAGTRALFTLQ